MALAKGPPGSVAPVDWGAAVDYDKWRDRYTIDDAWAIHHGGGGDYTAARPPFSPAAEESQLRSWESYHLRRGWRGLAYGWAIGQTGATYRARGWNFYAAHRGDLDADGISNNSEVIPVLFILSGLRHSPSPAMLDAFENLREWGEAEIARSGTLRLYGHRELSATACPGPLVMEYVTTHRYAVPPGEPPPATDWTHEVIMAMPTIRRGDGFKAAGRSHLKADVKRGQGLLLAAGFKDRNTSTPETATDGLFGSGTETATRGFQTSVGLAVDGVIGEATWTRLLGQS